MPAAASTNKTRNLHYGVAALDTDAHVCYCVLMTQGMRKAIDEAKSTATATHTPRINPLLSENIRWALKQAGMINDSGWLTPKGLAA